MMAHHDLPGSDEAVTLAEEGKIHEVPASGDKALVSNPQNDVMPGNKAIVLIGLMRYRESLT